MTVQHVVSRRARDVQHLVSAWRLSSSGQSWLWWFAIAAMVVDHWVLVAYWGTPTWDSFGAQFTRGITRLAWPVFGLLPAYNIAVRGVDPARYYRPMLALLVASQIPLHLAMPWLPWWYLSIFGTLLLGILLIDVVLRGRSAWWLSLLALAPLVDYGLAGVLLPLAFALFLKRPSFGLAAAVAVVMVWNNWPSVYALIPLALPLLLPLAELLPPIPRLAKWAKYVIYPGHLLLLAGIAALFL